VPLRGSASGTALVAAGLTALVAAPAALVLGAERPGEDPRPAAAAPKRVALPDGTLRERPPTAPVLARRAAFEDARLPPVPAGSDAVVPVKHTAALIERRTVLRARPGGRRVGVVGRRTGFGGRQVVSVVGHRPGWLGVLHPRMPNGTTGWIPIDAARVVRSRWSLAVDRSAKRLRVRYDGRFVAVFRAGVGRSASPTPTTRFGITDRLAPAAGSPYGCCILALTGRQRNLPPGWPGGDRLALHGSPGGGVGQAVSSGCVRLRDEDMRWLMRRIPAGTRLDVVA
jgi:lipoprotein-anchoring transpeptidase ErfK/SrfK